MKFLEYVLNRYIFGVNSPEDYVFHSSGAAHGINADQGFSFRVPSAPDLCAADEAERPALPPTQGLFSDKSSDQ